MFSASAMPAINWLRTKTGTNIPAISANHARSERVRQFPDTPVAKVKTAKRTMRESEPSFLLSQNLPHLLDRETGILNRAAIEWKLNYEVLRAKRYRRPVSILLLSIDNLESTCEKYGALAGAELVTYLGSLLKEHTRDTDFVGRVEQNLFVIICPETPQLNALKIVRRVGRQMQARAMSWSNRPINTISVGSACSPSDGETVSLLLQKAMQHLDMAKREDGDCVFFTA
jgi:diguanylate cyclase (GGDEF)-like protein